MKIKTELTLDNKDISSILKGVVSSHIVKHLQSVAKSKIQHDLQIIQDRKNTQKENQDKIDGGLKMFGLYSDRKIKPKKPKSQIFLAKDLDHARTEYGYLTSWGVQDGVILEWDGAVPKYEMFIAGTVKRYPR